MKKIGIVFIVILILCIPLKAQDKMNPDGYIKGITLILEPGYDYGSGTYKADPYGIDVWLTQNRTLHNFTLRLALLFPASEKHSYFLNFGIGRYGEKAPSNNFFSKAELTYTNLHIGAGIKFYWK